MKIESDRTQKKKALPTNSTLNKSNRTLLFPRPSCPLELLPQMKSSPSANTKQTKKARVQLDAPKVMNKSTPGN